MDAGTSTHRWMVGALPGGMWMGHIMLYGVWVGGVCEVKTRPAGACVWGVSVWGRLRGPILSYLPPSLRCRPSSSHTPPSPPPPLYTKPHTPTSGRPGRGSGHPGPARLRHPLGHVSPRRRRLERGRTGAHPGGSVCRLCWMCAVVVGVDGRPFRYVCGWRYVCLLCCGYVRWWWVMNVPIRSPPTSQTKHFSKMKSSISLSQTPSCPVPPPRSVCVCLSDTPPHPKDARGPGPAGRQLLPPQARRVLAGRGEAPRLPRPLPPRAAPAAQPLID